MEIAPTMFLKAKKGILADQVERETLETVSTSACEGDLNHAFTEVRPSFDCGCFYQIETMIYVVNTMGVSFPSMSSYSPSRSDIFEASLQIL